MTWPAWLQLRSSPLLAALLPLRRSSLLTPLLLGAFTLVVRLVKTDYPLWADELITARWSRLDRAIEYHRFDNNAPLPPVVNYIVKSLLGDDILIQRLPHILTGSAAIIIFYFLMRYLLPDNRRQALVFSLIPITSMVLIFYSHEIRPYSYVLLFSIITFYFGYRVFIDATAGWPMFLGLLIAYALWPLTHYSSWLHLFSLTFVFACGVMVFGRHRLRGLARLVLVMFFAVLAYVPWADSVEIYAQENFMRSVDPKAIYRPGLEVLWDGLERVAGSGGIWMAMVFSAFLLGVFLALGIALHALVRRRTPDTFDRFALLLIAYLVLAVGAYTQMRNPEPIFMWRHMMFLIWPFLIVTIYALNRVVAFGRYAHRVGQRRGIQGARAVGRRWLASAGGTVSLGVAGAFIAFYIGSNVVNSGAYLLSNNRYYDWRGAGELVDELIMSGKKNAIYTDSPSDMFLLRWYMTSETAKQAITTFGGNQDRSTSLFEAGGEAAELATCCAADIIVVDKARHNEALFATSGFEHVRAIGKDPFLEFLIARDAAPCCSDYYEIAVVYW